MYAIRTAAKGHNCIDHRGTALTALGPVVLFVAECIPDGDRIASLVDVDCDVVVVHARSARVNAGETSAAVLVVIIGEIIGAFRASASTLATVSAVVITVLIVVFFIAEAVPWENVRDRSGKQSEAQNLVQ